MSSLILDQGFTWERIWNYENPDKTPINLTGCSAAFQIRLGHAGGALLADLDTDTKGGVVIDGLAGSIAVTVTATLSHGMKLAGGPQGSGSELQATGCPRVAYGTLCVWGLELTMTDGTKPPFDEGPMVITPEIVQ